MKFPDRISNGQKRLGRFLFSSALAGLLSAGCTPGLGSKETACSSQTLIHGENPALTLRQPDKFTARAYNVNSNEKDARVIIALEPGALNSGLGPNQLAQSKYTRNVDLALIIDASKIPAAIGVRYSFPGENQDRIFATLATEAVGYNYDQCNIVDVRIDNNYPSLTVNNGRRVVPAFPM
jgi:hypothetical protein